MNKDRTVTATGYATVHDSGVVLDAWFPSLTSATDAVPETFDSVRRVRIEHVALTLDLDDAPSSTVDAYLRLHALSLRLIRPNELNLDGLFSHLPTVAWTNAGPMHPDDVGPHLRGSGVQVTSLDKFPRMTDYIVPPGVRIADASRVRLGAYLSPGTTVMHEGFVNFNAGTLGRAMVEGRISQGVTVGDGTDVGGGASIMGTLSGGGTERISIGERSLLGANSGVGISLGDDCIVEAGLYVTAGTKVVVANVPLDPNGRQPVVKASTLSGRDGLLFRRNSVTGAVEVSPRSGVGIALNETLHA